MKKVLKDTMTFAAGVAVATGVFAYLNSRPSKADEVIGDTEELVEDFEEDFVEED